MDLSIVIVNHNTKKLTEQTIQSVFDTTKNISYEIIVADNSTDPSQVLDMKDDRVKILKNLENKIEEILQIIYGADIEKCKDNEETISLDNITEIKLENVSLKNDRQVQLKGIYLEIKAGRHIAIIGETGAG